MIKDKYIEVKVNHANRKKYEEILNTSLKNGQIIKINQNDLLKTSRIKVECICDNCGKTFSRKRVDIKGEATLCGTSCRNEYITQHNPNPEKDKIEVCCNMSNKKIELFESKYKKQKKFLLLERMLF